MFRWTVPPKLVAGPVIHSGETDMDMEQILFNPCRQYFGNTKQYFGNKANPCNEIGNLWDGCQ